MEDQQAKCPVLMNWGASHPRNVCSLLGFEFLSQLDLEAAVTSRVELPLLAFSGVFDVISQWLRAIIVLFARVRQMAYS